MLAILFAKIYFKLHNLFLNCFNSVPAAVGADEEVAAENEADGVVAVPEPDACLIGVDNAIGQAPGTMFRMELASPMIRMVMSSLVFRSAEAPPPGLVLDPFLKV